MSSRVREEDGVVDHRVVERSAVALVFEERRSVDTEQLEPNTRDRAEPGVGPDVRHAVREPDHRFVPTGLRVDSLRILRRQAAENLDLSARKTVTRCMCAANG